MERNSIEIRVWMQRHQVRQVDIRRELGYADPKTVWATIEGRENNRRVLGWLLEKGCPAILLALPEDMQVAA
ncbi:MAG: XRE family transcriptional regulator [bacterium]|nr:XRE family transcriptional regulator [bacterium]